MIITAHDIDTLARTAWGEARGNGLAGMRVPAWVAANRARNVLVTPRKQFGNGSIASACWMPEQFSCWNSDDPNRPKVLTVTLDDSNFQLAYYTAIEAAHQLTADPTIGRLFYWSTDIPTPQWAMDKPFLSIGPFRLVADA